MTGRVSVPPSFRSVSPPDEIPPVPLAVNSPTHDPGCCVTPVTEEIPDKSNEYVPDKPGTNADTSCKSISPVPVANESNAMICACWGEMTTIRKCAVAALFVQVEMIPSQNCIVPRPSAPME